MLALDFLVGLLAPHVAFWLAWLRAKIAVVACLHHFCAPPPLLPQRAMDHGAHQSVSEGQCHGRHRHEAPHYSRAAH